MTDKERCRGCRQGPHPAIIAEEEWLWSRLSHEDLMWLAQENPKAPAPFFKRMGVADEPSVEAGDG